MEAEQALRMEAMIKVVKELQYQDGMTAVMSVLSQFSNIEAVRAMTRDKKTEWLLVASALAQAAHTIASKTTL